MNSRKFDSDIVFFKTVKDIRDKNAQLTIEPLGDVNELTRTIRWTLDDVLAEKSERDKAHFPFLRSNHVWHGHPDDNFDYGKSELNKLVEDGKTNKPSLPDISYLITQLSSKMTIALPDGVVTLTKNNSKLTQELSKKLNFLGTRFPLYQDVFFTAEIYSLLMESGIDRYNTQTWLNMLQYVGLTVEYIENEFIEKDQLQKREIIKPSGKILSSQYSLFSSQNYSERVKELIEMAY